MKDETTHLLRRGTQNGSQHSGKKEVAIEDLYPTPPSRQTWSALDFFSIWLSLSVNVSTYLFGSSLLAVGLNWWHATLAVFLGNVVVLVPLLLNGYAGSKYGIAFPVFLRSSFGRRGAVVAALSRGVVAIGWFAFNVWLGAQAIHSIILTLLPFLTSIDVSLGAWMGLSFLELFAFVAFLAVHMVFVYKGIESMKVFEVVTAPLLGVSAVVLLAWAWTATGSLSAMLDITNQFESGSQQETTLAWLFRAFLPGLTAMVGAWSTMALNILDFTRFAKSQHAQIVGQSLGLPIPTTMFAFVGIAVTGATAMLYGQPLWQPSELFAHFPPVWRVVANLVMVFSVLAMNITANLVSPANDFSNINPDRIDFKMGGYITGLAGLLIFPWKLFANADGFIFIWLIGYSAVLGAVAGVMLCDFHVLKRRELIVEELYFDPAKGGDVNLHHIAVPDDHGGVVPTYDALLVDAERGDLDDRVHHKNDDDDREEDGDVDEDEVLPGVGVYEYWRGWNVHAGIAVGLALLPCLPGFLVAVGLAPAPDSATSSGLVRLIVGLYHYAWFVAFAIAFVSYYLLMTLSAWEGQRRYEERLAAYRALPPPSLPPGHGQRRARRERRGHQGRDFAVADSDDRAEIGGGAASGSAGDVGNGGGRAAGGEAHGRTSTPPGARQHQQRQHQQQPRRRHAHPDNQPSELLEEDSYYGGNRNVSSSSDDDDDGGGGDRRDSSSPQDSRDDERFYAESPTITKFQHEKQLEQRRRARRLVAQWRQRQTERANVTEEEEETVKTAVLMTTKKKKTTHHQGKRRGDDDDKASSQRYVFFEEDEDDEHGEDEDKDARSHFMEYTEAEYDEMQRSLVREGMMSPPDDASPLMLRAASDSEASRWHLAEKHLSI